jgi:hypothetical protein
MLRPAHWVPFLVLAAVQYVALGILVAFHQPAVSPIGVPLIRLAGGDKALHYPMLFLYLPTMYSRIMLVLAVLFASVVVAVATLRFARTLGFAPAGRTPTSIRRQLPTVILVSVPPTLAILALSWLAGQVPTDLILNNPKVRWGVRGGVLLAVVLVQSFVSYTTAWVVLQGHSVAAALRDSCRVTARTFLPTFLVVAIPVVALYPLSYLMQRGDLFFSKLRPETIAGLLALRIAAELLFGFLLVGAITRLFLWRTESAR